MTSELSREAAELVKQGRDALRPTAADKERVLSALKGQLAPIEPTGGSAVNAGATGAGTKALLFGSGAAVAIAAVVGLSMGSGDGTPDVRVEAPVVAVTAPSDVVTIAAPDDEPIDVSELEPATTPSGPSPVATRGNPSDRLAEEVALLTRAQREYHAGNLSAALASVNEHQRKFARGTLGQERVRLRVKILCGLGRDREAEREHRKLQRLSPGQVAPVDVCRK